MPALNITTPAFLFPAISLLFLAYTNRSLVISQLLRSLHGQMKDDQDENMNQQIANLRQRIQLIRWMQILGVLAFLCCIASIASLLFQLAAWGLTLLAASLLLLFSSLLVCLWEVNISNRALSLQLSHLER